MSALAAATPTLFQPPRATRVILEKKTRIRLEVGKTYLLQTAGRPIVAKITEHVAQVVHPLDEHRRGTLDGKPVLLIRIDGRVYLAAPVAEEGHR